jgi:hypothetical protein
MKLEKLEKKYADLQKQFVQISYICNGSVMHLYRKCGKPNCGCKDNPQMRHGPYFIWTRKEKGKTITRSLSKKQAERCLEYIENLKKIEKIIEEMKKTTIQMIEEGKQS